MNEFDDFDLFETCEEYYDDAYEWESWMAEEPAEGITDEE